MTETKTRIDQSVDSYIEPPKSRLVWSAVGAVVVLSLILQVRALFQIRPSDVLAEVQELREDLYERTRSRIFREEFESFLRNNPELIPPNGWSR